MLLLSPSDRFCRASHLRRVPVPGWPAAVTFLCAYIPGFCLRCLGRLGHAPQSRVGWTLDSDPARRPTVVSECSAIAGLVALTTAASRWRHCVPFVPFAAPLCSLFPRRVTCAPFENFYFVILNPFFTALVPVRASPVPVLREIFINQQEITTLTVIWARQLVSPQPKLGPVP